ncbi:ras guanine nucleotide exchange factor domain-containing protein [Entophlyctis helioformis]|nr:ras guanine nucleotide exchange factor domain-containing protein [Entophlyctis helioformis]
MAAYSACREPSPDYAVGFYVRVQLPTGDTTMIMAEETTSVSEVVKSVESKKDITIEDWTATIMLPDGKKLEVDPEQTMSNFKEIDKLLLQGSVVSPHPLAPPSYTTTRRGSVLGAPSGKQTTIRMSSDIFPHVVSDNSDASSVKSPARFKTGIKTAFSNIFGKKSVTELELGVSVGASSDSLARLSGPRSASVTNDVHFNYPDPQTQSQSGSQHRRNPVSSESYPEPPDSARSDVSMSFEASYLSSSVGAGSIMGPKLSTTQSDPRASKRYSTQNGSNLNIGTSSMGTTTNSTLPESPVPATLVPPSPSSEEAASMSFSGSVLAQKLHGHAATDTMSTPFLPLKEESPINSRSDGINKLGSSSEENSSREHVDNLASQDTNNIAERLRSTTSSATEASRMVLVRMHYLDDTSTVLKITGDTTMEQLLARICKRRSYDLDALTTQVMGASTEKIMDLLTDARHLDEVFLDMILLTFRVLFTLKWWVEHHWNDFGLSTEFRHQLEGFLQEVVAYPDFDFGREAREIIRIAERKRQWFEDLLATYALGERRGKAIESMFIDLEPVDIAQQLCIYNQGLFKSIHPIEFLNEIWIKDNDSSPSFKFFVNRFDKESFWVVTELVTVKDIKKRVTILKKLIQLVKESLDLNNFFTTFALIAGLNLTPVQRLKKTWESKKLWAEVEKIADPSRNMKAYRDKLAASTPPMVPFLPIYLKDLTFINDGNQSKVRGMINVEKLRMMANRVLEITSLARSEYPFEHKPAVLNYLAKPRVEKDMAKLKEMATEVETSNMFASDALDGQDRESFTVLSPITKIIGV